VPSEQDDDSTLQYIYGGAKRREKFEQHKMIFKIFDLAEEIYLNV
jgi:hypothetical protein